MKPRLKQAAKGRASMAEKERDGFFPFTVLRAAKYRAYNI